MTDANFPTQQAGAPVPQPHAEQPAPQLYATEARDVPVTPLLPVAGKRRGQPAAVLQSRQRDENAPRWEDSADRVPVFTVVAEDGTQRVFTMPAKPHPGIMLWFLKQTSTRGDAAMVSLFDRVLDPGATDALIDELENVEDPEAANAMMRDISQRIQMNLAGGLKT